MVSIAYAKVVKTSTPEIYPLETLCSPRVHMSHSGKLFKYITVFYWKQTALLDD